MTDATGVRRTDNSDEAAAAMRALEEAPALTLTGAELRTIRAALAEAGAYAARQRRRARNRSDELSAQNLLDAVAPAVLIVGADTS
jgi:hypothetical protein